LYSSAIYIGAVDYKNSYFQKFSKRGEKLCEFKWESNRRIREIVFVSETNKTIVLGEVLNEKYDFHILSAIKNVKGSFVSEFDSSCKKLSEQLISLNAGSPYLTPKGNLYYFETDKCVEKENNILSCEYKIHFE
jgi:hypothetical protein